MASSSFISGRALFPAVDSTLSISEINDLVDIMYKNHSQPSVYAVSAFLKIAKNIESRMRAKVSNEWMSRMGEAISALELVTVVVEQSMNDILRSRAFTAIVALSISTSKSSTLDVFRRKCEEIIDFHESPFTLNDTQKSIIKVYLSSSMMFWLAYDQIDVSEDTRNEGRSALEMATLDMMTTDSRFVKWLAKLSECKFDSNVRTAILSNGVCVTTFGPTGVLNVDFI
jgi:hypothetical protein